MADICDEAIILQVFPYGETSRILRLLTLQHGVRSAMARGALRPRSRFGALEPFAEGTVTLHLRDHRDLQTLSGFDLTRSPHRLGAHLLRFGGASLLAEIVLRTGSEESQPDLYCSVRDGLDRLREASVGDLEAVIMAEAWSLVDRLGFGPSLHACVDCGRPLEVGETARFDHAAGAIRCPECGAGAPGRDLPEVARRAVLGYLAGRSEAQERMAAHWQLLRRHLEHHVVDGPLKSFSFLETALAGPP